MSHRSTAVPNPWVRHSMVNSLALVALASTFIAGLATSASAITVYDRNAAVAYANANWNKVVNDGYFWINGSTANYYGAGQPVPVNVSGEASGIGDDCAHYVSSVLGTPGGGLTIPSRTNTYGEPGAAALDELLVGTSSRYGATYKYGQLVSSVSQLTPGDVIGYNWGASSGGDMSTIDHTVVYIGNGLVDCHATSHLGANWTLGGAGDYFFIHITLPDSIVPTTPSNGSPAANAFVSNLTPKLTANAFSDGAIGSSQVAAEWKILTSRGNVVFDSGTDTTNLTSLTIPSGILNIRGSYTWQVRYQDNYGDWSSYSTATSLTAIMPGDYNNDGVVNAADYVVWRSNPANFGGSPDGYNAWRANLGTTSGSGTALASALSQSAVPEPASVALMLIGSLFGVSVCRR